MRLVFKNSTSNFILMAILEQQKKYESLFDEIRELLLNNFSFFDAMKNIFVLLYKEIFCFLRKIRIDRRIFFFFSFPFSPLFLSSSSSPSLSPFFFLPFFMLRISGYDRVWRVWRQRRPWIVLKNLSKKRFELFKKCYFPTFS